MVLYNKHCISHAEKFQPSATTAATFARPMSIINLQTNKFNLETIKTGIGQLVGTFVQPARAYVCAE